MTTPDPKTAPTRPSRRMTKLSVPSLQTPPDGEKLRATMVNSWLARCEDAFEGHEDLTGDTLKEKTKILQAGLRMEDPTAASWWAENRTELKALSSWKDFAQRVRDRFVPSNWRIDALEAFYAIRQGSTEAFPTFAARLQQARNNLAGAGTPYAITDAVMKNHLLFYSTSRLRKRVLAIPAIKYHDLKVDGLTNILATTWASLMEDGASAARLPTSSAPAPARFSSAPVSSPALSKMPPLSEADRQRLRDLGGCFHCRRHPGSPGGWKPHAARECPGDAAAGIPPRSQATVAAVTFAEALDETNEDAGYIEPQTVASVYARAESPAALWTTGIIGNGTDSEGEDDWP